MNLVLDKLVGFAISNRELSRNDAAKLRFMLEVIFLNVMELVIFSVFFTVIGRFVDFLICIGVLMSVRIFSGGFHFKKYRYCIIFSGAIFVAAILVLPDISQINVAMVTVLIVTIIINIVLAPVSKRNAAHPAKNNLIMKIVSTALLLVYALLLLHIWDNRHVSMITWILFIQSIQLIIGKVLILHSHKQHLPTNNK